MTDRERIPDPEYPTDDHYMRNGFDCERFFWPVSHTDARAVQSWDTPYEYRLLRSHAVSDDVMAQMAAALESVDTPEAAAALDRYNKLGTSEQVVTVRSEICKWLRNLCMADSTSCSECYTRCGGPCEFEALAEQIEDGAYRA